MNSRLRIHYFPRFLYILTTAGAVWGMVLISGQQILDKSDNEGSHGSDQMSSESLEANRADSLALLEVYRQFGGELWTNNSGWRTAPLKDWFGVTMSNGRVTGLELANNNVGGTEAREFPRIEFLELVDLRDNELWALPDFNGFTTLQEVKVENNDLDFYDLEKHINQAYVITYVPQRINDNVREILVNEGDSREISRSFSGEFNSYQWYLGSVALQGETSDTLEVSNITQSNIGPYTLEVTNSLVENLTLRSRPFLFNIVSDFDLQWLDIGEYHNTYHVSGGWSDVLDDLVEGMSFPAIVRNSGHLRGRIFAIAVEDWVDPSGQEYPIFVHRSGTFQFNSPDRIRPTQHSLIGKYEDTLVEINGKPSKGNPIELDEVRPDLAADRMIHNITRTELGLTIDRKIYAYANEYHDNYHLIDYSFCNTGNVDGDDEIELPNQTLHGVYLHWTHRWRGSKQAAWATDAQQVWGRYTLHDVVGDGFADYPVDFQAQYSWSGLGFEFFPFDSRGGPLLKDDPDLWEFAGIAPEDTVGRLADANMVGRSTIHADRSSTDQSHDLEQPAVMQLVSNDFAYISGVSHEEVFRNSIILRNTSLKRFPHFADIDYPDGDFWDVPSNSLTWGQDGGFSPTTGYGPYEIAPNECVNIFVSEGIGGLGYDAATKIGMAYKRGGSDRDRDVISFDANGDGEISDQPFNYDEVFLGTESQTKNQWVMSARDSLFQTFYRARDAHRASNKMSVYPIAEPPRAPREFKLRSRPPNQIEIEWLPASGGPEVLSWELYRSEGREDNLFVTGCLEDITIACGYEMVTTLPATTTNYTDTDLNPDTDYYYYLQGVGARQAVDKDAISGTPLGVPLKSGRYLTQTYTPISPSDIVEDAQEIPVELSLGSNFPNPFSDKTRLEYLLSDPANVSVTVYDILGKRVQVLEMGEQEAGLHSVTLEIQGLPSGAYIYVIDTGSVRADGMMIKTR